MEKVYDQNSNSKHHSNTLAYVLIGFGLYLLLSKSGFVFPDLHCIITPIVGVFKSLFNFIFSWPFILLFIGLILLAGKRSGGLVLLVIAALFILPKVVVLSGIAMFILFPIALIVLGIALLIHIL
jgi:predicted membrane protein